MARGKPLTVLLDAELYQAVEMDAAANRISMSAVVRDVLRQGFKTVESPRQRGWIEGFNAGKAEAKRVVTEALHRAEVEGN